MRVLINGREARGPGGIVIATLATLLVLAVIFFVVLPIIGIALAAAAVGGVVYLGARSLGLLGSKRRSIESDEAHYRVESSRQHLPPNDQ
jgi:hypothetical protein